MEKHAIDEANVTTFGDTLYGITIGSEGLYRGTYQVNDLLGWISSMRTAYPNTQLGTADSWNCWNNGSMDSIITSGIQLV